MEIEALLQSQLERIHESVARLRVDAVTAAPAEKISLERRIGSLGDACVEIVELLRVVHDLLECCTDDAVRRRIGQLVEEEARLRVAHAEGADEGQRLRDEHRIVEARDQRDSLAQEQFEAVVRAVDFLKQRRAFKERVDKDRIVAVHLQGDDDHGLYWLRHRFQDLLHATSPLVLAHSFAAGAVDHTLSGLLQGLARRLCLPCWRPAGDLGTVIDALCKLWPRRSVVLVLDHVDRLGPEGLAALLDGFWGPLCDALGAAPKPPGGTCMAALLLDHTSAPAGASRPATPRASPREPLVLDLPPFDEAVLEKWVDAHFSRGSGGGVPLPLRDAGARADIIQQHGGIPFDVMDALCRAWPYAWYAESDLRNQWWSP